ncbi:MAG: SIS domain-containing protein [Clostridiales bacterium]|nr:SIS domain-containing protein [Clostridiales bacterium]
MKEKLLTELTARYPALEPCAEEIKAACQLLSGAIRKGGKILLAGNGGSCADCEHISGELLKGFLSKRPLTEADKLTFAPYESGAALAEQLQYGIPALPLPAFSALATAFSNDVEPDAVYAQLIMALGKPEDVFLGLSTSGNAKNVCQAAIAAKARGLKVIGLTGISGGKLADLCDCCIRVPEKETFKVQELHLPVYHCICAVLEAEFFQ